jgi:hypothetical protein
MEKKSDVLLRFAEPILDRLAPLDEKKVRRNNRTYACRYRTFSTMPTTWPTFEMLVQRKTELYPRNRRLFMGLELAESADRLHVNAVSTDLDRMG